LAIGAGGSGAANPSSPTVEWKLPEGWDEVPAGEMRYASFKVKGKDGKSADVGIFPLPGRAGSDLDNVNRWRQQVGQPPVTQEELDKQAETVDVDGQKGQIYDQAGKNVASGEKLRILAAIIRRESVAWFIKLMGDDDLVAQQKPAFVNFTKSLKFGSAQQPQLPPSHPPIDSVSPVGQNPPGVQPQTASSSKPSWTIPPGWQETSGGQFLAAKFILKGGENEQAAVNVSTSSGEGGGLVGNVNRWRGQLGLGQLSEAEINKLVTQLETEGGKASLVDISGKDPRTEQPSRIVGAIVPRNSQTWFYKLMGTGSLVEREKANFIKFIQTAKYPNAS
jgi:hypothetical protein